MSGADRFLRTTAGVAVARREIPALPVAELADAVVTACDGGLRVAAWFGVPRPSGVELVAVLADDARAGIALARATLTGPAFPSRAAACPQLHLFERELAEQFGLVAEGHPAPAPVRSQPPLVASAAGAPAPALPGTGELYRVEGQEVHEVGVGPVHAGVIEPGHFRFQCHGEQVFHLEIRLGYQHRGVERALIGGPDRRTIHYLETAAGDTTIGHATAGCELIEALAGTAAPPRGAALRAIALELERLANHTGDLGALAGDVGYLPTASFCGRIRGDFLNLSAELCGSRFGRGLVRPGGSGFDLEPARRERLRAGLDRTFTDARSAIELLWESSSVMERFETTGVVPREDALALGLVGPAARASGVDRDLRRDHPAGAYRDRPVAVATAPSGDVDARARVRWLEMEHALAFLHATLAALPEGEVRVPVGRLAPESLAVSLVEGWRGEICHVALTDRAGRFARYKIVDPSFHNWSGLARALRGGQISDFPLCNKSFNLSYCGHDL
jgi:Ni,Fe-hydrogenase III large subunit